MKALLAALLLVTAPVVTPASATETPLPVLPPPVETAKPAPTDPVGAMILQALTQARLNGKPNPDGDRPRPNRGLPPGTPAL